MKSSQILPPENDRPALLHTWLESLSGDWWWWCFLFGVLQSSLNGELQSDKQGSSALEPACKRRHDSPASTLTRVPSPSSHNHPQALIRMWRTLHRTRSGALVCDALVYPRGRMTGGQDLAGHCTTLSSPHGSLLWTFTGWEGSGELSQNAFSSGSCTECISFQCCDFFPLPLRSLWKRGIKGTLSTPSRWRANLLPNRHHKWPLSLGNSIWCCEE